MSVFSMELQKASPLFSLFTASISKKRQELNQQGLEKNRPTMRQLLIKTRLEDYWFNTVEKNTPPQRAYFSFDEGETGNRSMCEESLRD